MLCQREDSQQTELIVTSLLKYFLHHLVMSIVHSRIEEVDVSSFRTKADETSKVFLPKNGRNQGSYHNIAS